MARGGHLWIAGERPIVKRRLILHLGLSKTGTTSIQTFLSESRDFRAAHGVTYPHLAGEGPIPPELVPSTSRRQPDWSVNHEALAMEIGKGSRASPIQETGAPL